jgi:hypothetical protein
MVRNNRLVKAYLIIGFFWPWFYGVDEYGFYKFNGYGRCRCLEFGDRFVGGAQVGFGGR